MKSKTGSPLGLYMIGVAALFLVGFFLLVVFGAQSYRDTVAGQRGNMDVRVLSSYLSTSVRAYDAAGGVRVLREEGDELRLADGDTGYSLRIYLSNGALVEQYCRDNAARDPDSAQIIGATETFAVEEVGEDVLRLTTDAGEILIRVRSEGGVS